MNATKKFWQTFFVNWRKKVRGGGQVPPAPAPVKDNIFGTVRKKGYLSESYSDKG